jgi:hypothetical protein
LTENHTPEFALRIRITDLPKPGEFDELDLSRFHVGQSYVVPSQLASLLIIGGYAEIVAGSAAGSLNADSATGGWSD